MFLSYGYRKYIGYDSKTKLYKWEYKITDSEFEEIDTVAGGSVAAAVIDTYEKRNLNVAANLIRAFIWQNKKYDWPISEIIKWNKQFNPKFAKYEEDINKYLILI